ncbi:MAG: hypothetical protein JWM11_1138 [Planctomycetaceae bacterium]|nr:hypothetical protein [Planctomycetaceae bacterium]
MHLPSTGVARMGQKSGLMSRRWSISALRLGLANQKVSEPFAGRPPCRHRARRTGMSVLQPRDIVAWLKYRLLLLR